MTENEQHKKNPDLQQLAAILLLNAVESATDDSDDYSTRKKEIKGAVDFFMKDDEYINAYCKKENETETKDPCLSYNNNDENKKSNQDKKLNSNENFIKPRNILIIGNGATKDAINRESIDTKILAKSIYSKMIASGEDVKNFIDNQLEKFKIVYNLNVDEFETILSACAAFDEKMVRDELKKAVNYKYIPSKFYEIVGHLFKHRYIDAIINFNFDEILDNIIEEELGDSDYKKIFLDGDCPMTIDEIKVRKRLKVPIYIKPHGTISYDSSLLFTKEHYHNIATKLKSFLKSLFFAEYHTTELLDLNIIVAGFGFCKC
jgi:hypothetical protein